jgi:hypothetical protein
VQKILERRDPAQKILERCRSPRPDAQKILPGTLLSHAWSRALSPARCHRRIGVVMRALLGELCSAACRSRIRLAPHLVLRRMPRATRTRQMRYTTDLLTPALFPLTHAWIPAWIRLGIEEVHRSEADLPRV